jgi:hypothetical protein
MSIGKTYAAEVEENHAEEFRCVHCGAVRWATLSVRAHGVGSSSISMDREGARRQAVGRATFAARKNAWSSVEGARCPACGRYDLRARAKVYAVALAIPLAIAFVVSYGASNEGNNLAHGILGALIGLVVGAPLAYLRIKSALQPVTFSEIDQSH